MCARGYALMAVLLPLMRNSRSCIAKNHWGSGYNCRILNPDDSQPDRFSANRILRILSRILRFSTRPIFGQPGRFPGRSLTMLPL
eukprot:COSAG02_NODE_157_length_32999_cov_31.863647_17_plen_85_part_00